uniref:Uncharacterized protein n=1 Tax=Cucumis sativus TaxID=3659 RepID=A0A0A0KV72_CUCSA
MAINVGMLKKKLGMTHSKLSLVKRVSANSFSKKNASSKVKIPKLLPFKGLRDKGNQKFPMGHQRILQDPRDRHGGTGLHCHHVPHQTPNHGGILEHKLELIYAIIFGFVWFNLF